jgi:hypothetical protein
VSSAPSKKRVGVTAIRAFAFLIVCSVAPTILGNAVNAFVGGVVVGNVIVGGIIVICAYAYFAVGITVFPIVVDANGVFDAVDSIVATILLNAVVNEVLIPSRNARPYGGARPRWSGFLRDLLCGALGRGGRAVAGAGSYSGWRVMLAAARLMPPAAGRRWLGEAESFLAEAHGELLRGAVRSYLAGAPQVIAITWAAVSVRWARSAVRKVAAW